MVASNLLTKQPPHPVEHALRTLGANLRTARTRRGLTLRQAAEKVGAGVRAVADAERGKPSTAVAVYVALLWLYGLLGEFERLADPAADSEGLSLELRREPKRVRPPRELDNDF